ncbi:hypothetical protein Daus18300_010443 [Diaporthe australafricana]|uniref:DUF7025 domain-containing protein n=1 Tax=Diaporthe australafricana TaxID=127596 RepID=A0ABR3WAD8_9PEZI
MDSSTIPIIGEDLNPTRPQEAPVPTDHLVKSHQEHLENSEPIFQANDPTTAVSKGYPEPADTSRKEDDGSDSDSVETSDSDCRDKSDANPDPSLCTGTKAEVPGKSSPQTPSQDAERKPRPRVGYSNKFLYDSNKVVVTESWPHVLDLDRDRENVTATANVEPVVELVTIVKTNITESPYTRDSTYTTATILSNSKVATNHVGLEVVVNSRRVIEALKRMITYYPNLDLSGTSLKIAEPYAVFFHFRDEIKDYLRTYPGSTGYQSNYQHPCAKRTDFKACDEETYAHLGAMQEVIEKQCLEEVEEEIGLHHETPSLATYRMLWLLFKPGTKVYRSERGRWTAGVVLSVGMDKAIQTKGDALRIRYWNLGFDGFRLGRWEGDCFIKPFEGTRRIIELEICPSSFYDVKDSGLLRDTLIDQGKQYWKLIPGSQVDYSGKLPTDNIEWVSI